MTNNLCWMCLSAEADSGEHKIKKRLLKKQFSEHNKSIFIFSPTGKSYCIQGPNAKQAKHANIICRKCNEASSQPFDRAFDDLTDWFAQNPNAGGINLRQGFGEQYSEMIDNIYRYCAKSIGCEIIASKAILPDYFPNPLKNLNWDHFHVSISRNKHFLGIPEEAPWMVEKALGKSGLLANLNREKLDLKKEKAVEEAIWQQRIGCFQINYWLGIQMDPIFGKKLSADQDYYEIVQTDLSLQDNHEIMQKWIFGTMLDFDNNSFAL